MSENDPVIKNCKPPEILAPAGDIEALTGALKGAADAVYLGVEDFNARKGAKNFRLDELEEVIDLAHSRAVKVFLALNIPLKQKELQNALDIVDKAYAWGIDAIILEDLGLMQLLSKNYPDLPLHASTQMTVHNLEGLAFVEEAGASRVILSRELSTEQVKFIVDRSNIEVELFVHGALCYSYSGRCLFSSFLGVRSANRGACTQPCRKQYRITIDGKEVGKGMFGTYPISCAELCTLPELDRIVASGVTSLKIEGRMKKAEYVTASSEVYKAAVDRICSTGKNLDPEEIAAYENDLAKLFYRGFTQGFICGQEDVTHQKYSSCYGVLIGRVKELVHSKHHVGLRLVLMQDIGEKDGIGIMTRMKMLGCRVDGIISGTEKVARASKGEEVILEISPKTGKAVRVQDEVFLATDNQLMDTLQKRKMRSLPIDIKVSACLGKPLVVEVSEARHTSSFMDEFIVPEARSSPTTVLQISEAISKLGDTPYYAASVEVTADDNIFIPVGVLNNARRQALSMLQEAVRCAYKRNKASSREPIVPGTDTKEARKGLLLSVDVRDPESLYSAVDAGADIVYIPMEHFTELYQGANILYLNDLKAKGTEVIFVTPQIVFDDGSMCVQELMEQVHRAGFMVACSNPGTVHMAARLGMPFVAQRELNVFNAHTVLTYSSYGARGVTLSTELNLDEIRDISVMVSEHFPLQLELLAYGRELLLITENDLLRPVADKLTRDSSVMLVDDKGEAFPLVRSGTRTLLYHSKLLDMRGHIAALGASGADVLRLDLSFHNKNEIREIIRAYRLCLEGKGRKPLPANDSLTCGHYFLGVL